MYVKNLTLVDYRNYEHLKLDMINGFNIFYGRNGQGKTNILEAVNLCAFGRSHRGGKDTDLITIGKDEMSLSLSLAREPSDVGFGIRLCRTGAKVICVNDKPIRKLADLVGIINIVIFSPEDMSLVKEGPGQRRKFLDSLLSQIRPRYFHDLQQYVKIIGQRNSLLKEIRTDPSLAATLDIWSEPLAEHGSRISFERAAFLRVIEKEAAEIHGKMSQQTEELKLEYLPSLKYGAESTPEEIRAVFLDMLKKSQEREIAIQTTICGPQREDFAIRLNGSDIRSFGSQGQQKTAVLALKLSEIAIVKEQTGGDPILLLDDVLSELDGTRGEFVFQNTGRVQTLITCTEKKDFRFGGGKALFFKVSDGTARAVKG